jgi:hypothetical protein
VSYWFRHGRTICISVSAINLIKDKLYYLSNKITELLLRKELSFKIRGYILIYPLFILKHWVETRFVCGIGAFTGLRVSNLRDPELVKRPLV